MIHIRLSRYFSLSAGVYYTPRIPKLLGNVRHGQRRLKSFSTFQAILQPSHHIPSSRKNKSDPHSLTSPYPTIIWELYPGPGGSVQGIWSIRKV